MPLVQTRGAASAQGFGEFAQQTAVNYIEDVFSTYLWDGNSTARNIVNGIDLATKGGMVWAKYRNATASNRLYDTNRGATKQIFSDLTNAEQVAAQSLTAFNTDGFSLGTGQPNENTATVVGWTFRKQAKFFDVVTYTGNGTNRSIAHNLGSVPGMMIVKSTSDAKLWAVYHRSIGNTNLLVLNSTSDAITNAEMWNNTTPTSTVFTVGTNTNTNASGNTYVAYLFAHNAGGFGTAGTDNVISCGSYTGNGSSTGPSINLGYEPQYVLIKGSSVSQDWFVADVMRGMPVGSGDNTLSPNLSDAELTGLNYIAPTATGFDITSAGSSFNGSGETYIYMAIRRPMKVPTVGTSVFNPVAFTGNNTANTTRGSITTDLVILSNTNNVAPQASYNQAFWDRLRGEDVSLTSSDTNAEITAWSNVYFNLDQQVGWSNGSNTTYLNNSGMNYVTYNLKRASGFFDVVCYTGTGSAATQAHNLGVAPELIIIKSRNTAGTNWQVYSRFTSTTYGYQTLQTNSAGSSGLTYGPGGSPNFESFTAAPTSSLINLASSAEISANGRTYVAYLFATCVGVSKVGSYTGNGSSQTINCGFAAGARFVLIKRTDSNGDWYVWDSARGIVAGNDPYLLLNSTAAEVTNTDYVDTAATGFEISSTAPAAINANGGSFIFLAIA